MKDLQQLSNEVIDAWLELVKHNFLANPTSEQAFAFEAADSRWHNALKKLREAS